MTQYINAQDISDVYNNDQDERIAYSSADLSILGTVIEDDRSRLLQHFSKMQEDDSDYQ